MHDHERFSKQMQDTLMVLRNTIYKLNVPLEQKDNLLTLVRELREFAYQVGRTEALDQKPG
jgi:hypothetical protein